MAGVYFFYPLGYTTDLRDGNIWLRCVDDDMVPVGAAERTWLDELAMRVSHHHGREERTCRHHLGARTARLLMQTNE